MYIAESPEVLFFDVPKIIVADLVTLVPIDRRFLEVCEPGSLKVVCGCDEPVAIGATIEGGNIKVRLAQRPSSILQLTAIIVGTRNGFGTWRFGDATQADYDANEAFLKMSKPTS